MEQDTNPSGSGEGSEVTNTGTDGGSQDGNTPSWWISEGVPGSGERPEWLPEKFNSMSDVVKSYNELEKKQAQSQSVKAPEEYSFGDHEKAFDAQHDAMKKMVEKAREKNIPQEHFDIFLESMNEYAQSFVQTPEEVLAELGDKGQERIDKLNNWAEANFSKETFEILTESMYSADAIKAIEEIRSKMLSNEPNVPNGNETGATEEKYNLKELQNEIEANLDKFKTDPEYRKEMRAKLDNAKEQSSYVDKKIGGY